MIVKYRYRGLHHTCHNCDKCEVLDPSKKDIGLCAYSGKTVLTNEVNDCEHWGQLPPSCPFCKSENVDGKGWYNHIEKKYECCCNDCNKTFWNPRDFRNIIIENHFKSKEELCKFYHDKKAMELESIRSQIKSLAIKAKVVDLERKKFKEGM